MAGSMTPEGWRAVRALFDEVVELEPAECARRLRHVAITDAELHGAVTALLAADAVAEQRLKRLDFEVIDTSGRTPGRGNAADPLGLVGRTVSHFHVLGPIGSGGMGVLYRARDTQLDRDVALKFPLPWYQLDESARHRFLGEGRAAGAVDHPNLCSIYEVGEAADGQLFMAMALYHGETLKARLERDGALDLREAVDLVSQVARGIAAAHAAGIIHRDLKPANLMLLPEGTVKVLDFGLAKVMGLALTGTRRQLGTVAYMAPEQIRGGVLGRGADLWALGVILYELVTGQRPFGGEHDVSVAHAIVHEEPTRPSALRRDLSRALEDLILRLLCKDPKRRVTSADELATSLATIPYQAAFSRRLFATWARPSRIGVARGKLHTATLRALPFRFAGGLREAALAKSPGKGANAPLRASIMTVAVLAVAAVWAAGYALTRSEDRTPSLPTGAAATNSPPAVAVLPFRATDGDLAFWREGMVDLLSFNLEGIGDLRKIDPQAVLTAWQAVIRDGKFTARESIGLEVGRRVAARFIVTGSAVRIGDTVRLTAEVHDVVTGRSRGSAQIEGAADSLQTLVDALTIQLVRLDRIPASGEIGPVNISRITTRSVPALKAYLAGEQHYRRSRWQAASTEFQRAVEFDSTFARALFRLGGSYAWHADGALSAEYYERAARFAAGLPERDALLLEAMVADDLSALETLTRKYPDDADGWYQLGDRAFHRGGATLLPARVFRDALEKALVLAPYYDEVRFHLLEDAFIRLDSARARELIAGYQATNHGAEPCPGYRLVYDLRWGSATAAARARDVLDTIGSETLSCNGSSTYMVAPAAIDRIDRHARAVIEGSIPGSRSAVLWQTVRARSMHGALRTAHRALAHAYAYSRTAKFAARLTAMLSLSGFPDTAAVARAKAVLARAPVAADHFWLGAFAVADERWAEAESAGVRIDAQVRALAAAGRAADARANAVLAPALRAYAAARRRPAAELTEFEAALSGIMCCSPMIYPVGSFLRYQIALLLFEQQELDEAQRYFESLYHYDAPYFLPAQFFLAQIAESRGRTSEARALYQLFARWWAESDPELQPWVRQAEAALVRLTG